jgi:predicted SAM-dependent methyltransferase
MPSGTLSLGPVEIRWTLARRRSRRRRKEIVFNTPPYKLNIGPGSLWQRPDEEWLTVDVDPTCGDIVTNFNDDFAGLPLADRSVRVIYCSHTLEHISVYRIGFVLSECYRVLTSGGIMRIVVPDARASLEKYLQGDENFRLFRRRIDRAKRQYHETYTLFEALKEDFISRSSQSGLVRDQLAHQNAWDFESLVASLARAGFDNTKVERSAFRESRCPFFAFEGTYPSEANEDYRSLYVEACK